MSTIITSTINRNTLDLKNVCTGEYVVRTVGGRTTRDYAKEVRVYPTDLLSSMTARDYISNESWEYALYAGGTGNCLRLRSSQASSAEIPLNSTPVTNWETKARLQIKDRSVNLAENLFEFRQTAGMFYSAGKAVYDAWRMWKGKKRWRKQLNPCDVAASELVYSFGINPIIGTLHDSYYALQERLADPLVIRLAGGARADRSGKTTKSTWLKNTPGWTTWDWKRTQRYVLYVRFRTEPPPPFTMGNPIELAWELIPYSWLVDGLIDVGSFLSSLDALRDVEWIKGTLSTRDRKLVYAYTSPSASYTGLKPGKWVSSGYSRSVVSTIPLGSIQWNPSKSWRKIMHAVSALTILNQRCKDGRTYRRIF